MKVGDLVTSQKKCYFDYDEEVKKRKIYSQMPGDILMINRIYSDGSVSGTSLKGIAHTGQDSLGKGSGFKPSSFRLSKPTDEGFLGDIKTWENFYTDKKNELNFYKVILFVTFLMTIWILLS